MVAPHETYMRLAMGEGDRARGTTGDNPWVGCVIVGADGRVLGQGHTQGPGEDHAEIAAARVAAASGLSIVGATLGTAGALVALSLIGDPLPGVPFVVAVAVLATAVGLVAALAPALAAATRDPIRELRVP